MFLLVHAVLTTGIYGEARGKITNMIIAIGIPTCLVLAAAASNINYREFSEQEMNATSQQ